MYRYAVGSLGALSLRAQSKPIGQVRGISQRAGTGYQDLEAQYAEARKWVSNLKKDTIPLNLAQTNFARSSGAGGQHVNK
jgi:protein subunit release factor B